MSIVTSISSPEPEKPRGWEEQASEYRTNYRNALTNAGTTMTLPARKTITVLRAASVR